MRFASISLLPLVLVSCVSTSGTKYEEPIRASALYQRLRTAEQDAGYPGINAINYSLELTSSNIETMALWLRDAYLIRAKKNPRYGLMYSDTLKLLANTYRKNGNEGGHAELMESGTMAFYSSQLIALEDLARCSDRTGGLMYRSNWGGERAETFSAHYASLSQAKRERLIAVVLRVAAKRDASDPDLGACGSGIKAMQRAIEAGHCREAKKAETTRSPGTTIMCDGGQYAELVSDEEWGGRRLEIRSKFREWLLEARE